MGRTFGAAVVVLAAAAAGCATTALPTAAPPLVDMEEPPAWLAEPHDEAARRELFPGAFSGLVARDARRSLDALVGEPEGLEVERVVENSPAAFAGLEAGDVLLEVIEPAERARELAGDTVLGWPSQWRALELGLEPGTRLVLLVDRAGRERRAEFVLAPRAAPLERVEAPRLREERKVGVTLRAPTEVEARALDLPPGAGATIVGLARSSPWRSAGLVFGDVVTHVAGERVHGPAALLDSIRLAPDDGTLSLRVVRDGKPFLVEVPVSRRERHTREVDVPLLFAYSRERDTLAWSALLGLFRYESTAAAWRFRLLWLIRFGRGDADRLREVDG